MSIDDITFNNSSYSEEKNIEIQNKKDEIIGKIKTPEYIKLVFYLLFFMFLAIIVITGINLWIYIKRTDSLIETF